MIHNEKIRKTFSFFLSIYEDKVATMKTRQPPVIKHK